MKTYKNLFPKIVDEKNLLNAFQNASEGKRFSNGVLDFEKNLAKNILCLRQELSIKQYQHGKYYFFCLFDPKERKISAADFRDQIVHHALCQIIEPIFDKKFIFDSYACRQVKGSHRAVKRLQKFLIRINQRKLSSTYCLKCDISKYFPSVNHQILIKLLEKKIKDKDTMWLLKEIISSYETGRDYNYLFSPESRFRTKLPRGIPIGNLTSQLFANLYLNELDQYLKHRLKIVKNSQTIYGIKYYIRYVDDFVILSNSKIFLNQLSEKIRTFLYDKLYLTLHPKKVSIFPFDKGIDFLGYVIFKDHIRLRSRNVKKFRKRLKKFQKFYLDSKTDEEKTKKEKKIQESITAWLAHAEQADTFQLRKAIFGKALTAKNQNEIQKFIQSWSSRHEVSDWTLRVGSAEAKTNWKKSEPNHKPFCQPRLF